LVFGSIRIDQHEIHLHAVAEIDHQRRRQRLGQWIGLFLVGLLVIRFRSRRAVFRPCVVRGEWLGR
jgi:hypothetical protein